MRVSGWLKDKYLTDRGFPGYYFTLLAKRYVSHDTSSDGKSRHGSIGHGSTGHGSTAGSLVFDAFECSRRGLEYHGEVPLSRLLRLVEGLPEQPGSVSWQIRGDTGPLGEALLQLAVQASPVVVCQRCLEPFEWPVDSLVALQLVRSQAELDTEDPISDEEVERGYEKVLGSAHFDVLEQIEDELILAMPYIARHPVCPAETPAGADVSEPQPEKRNPFAALGELRDKLKKD